MGKTVYLRFHTSSVFSIALSLFLLLSVSPSRAQEFSAHQLGDYGNATVMEVSGNYDSNNPDGSTNAAPRQAIAKEFFRTHKDDYDFIVVFTNFDVKMPDAEARGFYSHVKNDVRGIGQERFDYSSFYGSDGHLQGTIDMGNLAGHVSNPLDSRIHETLSILEHELLHRWGSFVNFKDAVGNTSSALLGKDGSHWSYLLDSRGSVQYGNMWHDNGDGTFTSQEARKYYSPLDLYLMGMIDKSKVPPMLLIENPAIDPKKPSEVGVTINGTARTVNVNDIIAAEGDRVPSAKESQKQFRSAFIYAVAPGTFNADDLYGLENIRNGFLTRYSILTNGMGLLQVASSPKEGTPSNPGVRPPSLVPRTLPPDINAAVDWLISRQQADGSWTDLSLTVGRDTAEAVTALQLFPSAATQFQAGMTWLQSSTTANNDYLVRRIEATSRAGGEISSLVQEVVSRANSDGGWGSGRNFISNSTDTALVLRTLATVGYSDQMVTGRAIAYLKGTQNGDGGWSGDDTNSTIQPTAAALVAFNAYRASHDLGSNLSRAVSFLAQKQNPDGGFGNSPSTVYDSALAVMALQDAGADTVPIARGVSYLLEQQSDNGSWSDSPFQTALAVRAVWLGSVAADLSVQQDDISFIPAKVTALPTTAVLNVKAWNRGRTDVPQAKVAVYDGSIVPEKKVTEQVVAFPGQSSVTLTFSLPVTDGNGHSFLVVIDPDSRVKESNKTNNVAGKELLPEVTYDFSVQTSDISVTPNPADIGKDVRVKVKLANTGTSDAYDVPVRIYLDKAGTIIDMASFSVDLPAGGSAVKEITWKAGLDGINLPLTVQIDPNSVFAETSKANNSASVPLTIIGSTLPNLSVSYQDLIITPSPAKEGGSALISVLVRNNGFSAAENVKVCFSKSGTSGDKVLLGCQVLPAVAVGQVVPASMAWNGITETGSKVISVQVDPDNLIPEIAKDDNSAFSTLEVLGYPELAVSANSIFFTPSAPKAGDLVSIAVSVKNEGRQDAVDLTVQLKEGGTLIDSRIISIIKGNNEASIVFTYDTTGKTGAHEITVVVDPELRIPEKNRENNSASKSFTLQDANLWLSERFISPNGDGIKDSTIFFFRLAASAQVKVLVVNRKGEPVRTFAGGDLDSTAGTAVTWDGKNDGGVVVDDGDYQIKVVDGNGAALANLPVTVDNNRSPFADAIGTKYLVEASLIGGVHTSNSDLAWLSDESRASYIYYDYWNPLYTNGLFSFATDDTDPISLLQKGWGVGTHWIAGHFEVNQYLVGPVFSDDGSKVAMNVTKIDASLRQLWVEDADGQNLKLIESVDSTKGMSVRFVQWSDDSTYFSYRKTNSTASIDELHVVKYDGSSDVIIDLTTLGISEISDSMFTSDNKQIVINGMKKLPSRNIQRLIFLDLSGGKKIIDVAPGYAWFTLEKWFEGNILISGDDGYGLLNIESGEVIHLFDAWTWPVFSPDSKYIAFVETKVVGTGLRLKVLGPDKKIFTAYESFPGDVSGIMHGQNGIDNKVMWSPDSSKIVINEITYQRNPYMANSNIVLIDVLNKKYKQVSSISKACSYESYYHQWYCYDNNNPVAKFFLPDNKNILAQNSYYTVFFLNTENSEQYEYPLSTSDVRLSPTGRSLFYSMSAGDPTGYYHKSISSVLNLTADLKTIKSSSGLALKGTAADRNFAGYRLEYADKSTPGLWNEIAPPSDVPVVDDLFTTWVPPYEGTFYVQLTVWDQAGNTAVSRKRVSWGLSSVITGLYKSREFFSPTLDGGQNTVELKYRVRGPAHLEFSVADATNNLVRTFSRDYSEPTQDDISWDGRDESGHVVPDGKYKISIFDFEFIVEVDSTPPDVAIALNNPGDPAGFSMTGHAVDPHLKSWLVEYGEGNNPSDWHEYQNGITQLAAQDQTGRLLIEPNITDRTLNAPFVDSTLWSIADQLWSTGKRFRITAEDYAGNKSSRMTQLPAEKLVLYKIDNLTGEVINRKDLPPGLHTFSAFETVRGPVASVRLQYGVKVPPATSYQWTDTGTSLIGVDGGFQLVWDTSGLPREADKLRLAATGPNNTQYLSNEITILGSVVPSPPPTTCALLTVDHGQADCGGISGQVSYYLQQSIDCPVTIRKARAFVVKPAGRELLQEFGAEQGIQGTVVTTSLPEGAYTLQVDLEYADAHPGASPVTKSAPFYVDRVLPSGAVLAPQAGAKVCPVALVGTLQGSYAVAISGTTSDDTMPGSYAVEFGLGGNPTSWSQAMARDPESGKARSISGIGPANGLLGLMDVSNLLGKATTVRLKAIDRAGNTSCTPRTFTIRNLPELTGVSADKQIFSSRRDRVSVSYTTNDEFLVSAQVQNALSGAVVATIFTDRVEVGGRHQFDWDGGGVSGALLPDGHYRIVVSAKEPCGSVKSLATEVEIDNTAPSVVLSYPGSGVPALPATFVEVIGTATDVHLLSYTLEMGEGNNPTLWRTVSTGKTAVEARLLGTWNTFDLRGLWTLRLRAEDTVGNASLATSVIDLGERQTLIRSLTATPKTFSPNADQKIDTADIFGGVADACQLKFEILDTGGAKVRSYSAVTASAGEAGFTWNGRADNGAPVADGLYTVKLTAALSSNPSVSQIETITVTVDTSPPAIVLSDPPEKAYLNKAEVVLSGSVTDSNLMEYAVTATGPSGTVTLDTGNQNRVGYAFGRMADLAEESYLLTVTAKDQGENQSKLVRSFTIDRTPPKVVIDSPKTGASFGSNRGVIDISGSIVEKNLDRYTLRYGSGEAPAAWTELVGGDMVPLAPNLSSWKVGKDDGVADGVYTLSLYARDKAGLEGEQRVRVVVDNAAPVVAITNLKEGDYLRVPFDIKGTLADANLDKGLLELAEGTCSTAVKFAPLHNFTKSVNDGVLENLRLLQADGDYCLRLSAQDLSGNKAETKFSVKVDSHPPAAPKLAGKIENRVDNLLSWNGNSESDLAGYNLYRDGVKLNSTLITERTFCDPGLKEGWFSYVVKAVDFAGNESDPSSPVKLQIDLTGPAVRISSPLDGARVSGLVDIKGTAFSAGDFKEYRVYLGPGSDPATWTLLRCSPLSVSSGQLAQWDTISYQDGAQFTIKVEGEDISGNITVSRLSVTIDNTPPAAPLLLSSLHVPNSANVNLTWRANTEQDLAGYLLYRNDQLVNATGNVVGNLKAYLIAAVTYSDQNLPDGKYSYYLVAMDKSGNVSDPSNTLDVTIDNHPPTAAIVTPADHTKFETRLSVQAQSADFDVAQVQFQYKKTQDSAWLNLGGALSQPPYLTYLDLKALLLPFCDYQLRAVATDLGGKVDPAPGIVNVSYTDLTPPAAPADLKGKANGREVNLNWTANGEPDLDGYHVYRTALAGERRRVDTALVRTVSYTDANLDDGSYSYEVTAVDRLGNESIPSTPVSARVYAPVLVQPFTPTRLHPIAIEGSKAAPYAQAELVNTTSAGEVARFSLPVDDQGAFRADALDLALGENRVTAKVTDDQGNLSRAAELVMVYDEPPAQPTGLAALVASEVPGFGSPIIPPDSGAPSFQVSLNWNPNTEAHLLGYNVFKDQVKLNKPSAVISGTVSASSSASADSWPYQQLAPSLAFDGNPATYWQSANQGSDPYWWELELSSRQLISHLEVHWGSKLDPLGNAVVNGAQDFEVQAWSGYAWITVAKVTGNENKDNVFDLSPSYATDKIRLSMSALMAEQVSITEIAMLQENPIQQPAFLDGGLHDGAFNYQVSAVDSYGFESVISEPVNALVGDLTAPGAPQNLSAEVVGASIVLDWSITPNAEPDLAGYNVYRQAANGWIKLNGVLQTGLLYADPNLRNGNYRYRLTAVDRVGNESAPSNEADAAIVSALPPAPVGLQVQPAAEGKVLTATWNSPGGSNASYHVYRSASHGGPYLRINTASLSASSYLDQNLTNGTAYYYVITALDPMGNESLYSQEAAAVPRDLVAPAQPRIFGPALPGSPLVMYQNSSDVAGSAEPGTIVDLYRETGFAGEALALAEDSRATQDVPFTGSNALLSPNGALLLYNDQQGALWFKEMASGSATMLSSSAWDAIWSPDGGKVAYSYYDATGNLRLGVYQRSSATTSNLTEDPGVAEDSPSWSADGKRLAFQSNRSGNYDIWVKNFDDGSLQRVASNVHASRISISPDATRLAYFEYSRLSLIDPGAGTITKLDDSSDGNFLAWSPDSAQVTFVSYRSGGPRVYTADAATRQSVELTGYDANGFALPAWSPDGSRLVYLSYESDGSTSLRQAGQQGEQATLLVQLRGNVSCLNWRQNGEIVVLAEQIAHRVRLKGSFIVPAVPLEIGENLFSAVAVDGSGNISPRSESISIVFDSGRLPDLVITESDISVYPPYPKPGEDVLVTASVRNPTNNGVDAVAVELYLWDATGTMIPLASQVVAHIAANGEQTVSGRFKAGSQPGTATVIAVVDPGNLIQELQEGNNTASKEAIVSDEERVTVAVGLNAGQFGAGQVADIGVTLRNSGAYSSGVLVVAVENADGQEVQGLFSQAKELPYGLNDTIRLSWNTGAVFSGSYRVHATVRDGANILSEVAVPFSIQAELRLDGNLVTDKLKYGPNENVSLGASFKNGCLNQVVTRLKVRVRILDAQNGQLSSDEREFANLLPSFGGSFIANWNTGLSPAGSYSAVLDIFAGDQLLTSKSALFNILPQPLLDGTLSVDPAVVLTGQSFSATYNISNHGNSAAAGTVRVTLQDLANQMIVASAEQPSEVQVNGSLSGTVGFDTTGLELKTYQVALAFKADTAWQNMATANVAFKDGIAPVVTIVSPQEGMSYTREVAFSVFATDEASGVDRVESSLDGAAWKMVPLADPSKGRYSTAWTPTAADSGGHRVSFRGADRAGNNSEPVSVSFIVQFADQPDTTPPILSVSTLADGSYTNNKVLNISGTVTDNVGVKDLQINGSGVPVNADGSFSYALQLVSGPNRVEVIARDLSDNKASDLRTINLDQNAPLLIILTPPDNIKTAVAHADVTGSVDESSTVVVKLGGVVQSSEMKGNGFTSAVTLVPGTNTIEVTATDLANNTSTQKRTVIYDDQKPSLAVTNPPQDISTNQPALLLKGTASDLYTKVEVTIAMDEQSYTPAVADDSFQQALTFTTEKSYAIIVTATNEVGTKTTVQRNVIYDITPPALTIDPVISPTNQASQIVTGTMEAGAVVAVTCPSASVAAVSYPTATTWSAPVGSLTSEINHISASATDAAGNVTTAVTAIVYDTTAPLGTITINNGALVTNSTQARLALSATDASGVSQMRFSADGSTWTDPELYGAARIWFLAPGDAMKQVQVMYLDYAGNWSEAVSATINLDATPPVVAAAPAGGIYNTVQSVTLSSNEQATIYYTTDGSLPTASSRVYGSPLPVTTNSTISFFAKDQAGNFGEVKAENYLIDLVPPVLIVSTLSDGTYTNHDTLNIAGTVHDDSGVGSLQVNGIEVPFAEDGSFSYALLLKNDANLVTVTATDIARNTAQDIRTIYLDLNAPRLTVDTPADNSKTGNMAALLTGTVDESATVVVTLNTVVQHPPAMNGMSYSATLTLAPGLNTIEVTATDRAGNTSSKKRTVIYDNQTPSLSVTDPAQDIRTNQGTHIIKGTSSDTWSSVVMAVTCDGVTYAPALVNGLFEQAVAFPTEKTYPIMVTATNEVGAVAKVQRNIIYDITKPALTINLVTSPTAQTSQIVAGTRESGVAVTVTCTTASVGSISYPTDTTWSVPITSLQTGDNAISATATDAAGNAALATTKITFATNPPESPFKFALFGNKSITLTGGTYVDSYLGSPASYVRGQYKRGDIGTNALSPCSIPLTNGVQVFGKAWVGSGGNPATGICVSGGSTIYNNLTGALAAVKDMTPKPEPSGGTPMGALNLSNGVKSSLAAGNYRYTSLNLTGGSTLTLNGNMTLHIDGNLTISNGSSMVIASGAVTLYVNGQKLDITGGTMVNSTLDPINLTIYGGAGLKTVNLSGGANLHAQVFAPAAAIIICGGQNTFGSLIGNTIDLSNGASVHYDGN